MTAIRTIYSPAAAARAAFMVLMLAAALAIPGTVGADHGNPHADVQQLFNFEDGSRADGASVLWRDDDLGTVTARIWAASLEPGAAYTYWWVVFNHPENCNTGACGEDDIFNPDFSFNLAQHDAVGLAVLGGNGEIASDTGAATFSGVLFEGSSLGHEVLIGDGGFASDNGNLLIDAVTAEVHVVIRNHGPAQSGADLAEQLLTFGGNCTTEPVVDDDPTFACFDEQFAVHMP